MFKNSFVWTIFFALSVCGPVRASDISSENLNLLVQNCREKIMKGFSYEKTDIYGNLTRSVADVRFSSYYDSRTGTYTGYGENGRAMFFLMYQKTKYKGDLVLEQDTGSYYAHCVAVGDTSEVLNIEYEFTR